jgi:hypothetical protein
MSLKGFSLVMSEILNRLRNQSKITLGPKKVLTNPRFFLFEKKKFARFIFESFRLRRRLATTNKTFFTKKRLFRAGLCKVKKTFKALCLLAFP